MNRLILILCFSLVALHVNAQHWQWALSIPYQYKFLDVAAASNDQSVSIFQDGDGAFHLSLNNSLGNTINDQLWYFENWIDDALIAVEVDSIGNIYMLSRQTFNDQPLLMRKERSLDESGHEYFEEVEAEIQPEPKYNMYYILDKFSPKMERITTLRLLKIDTQTEFGLSVHDFVTDAKGNCWIAGETTPGNFCWREDAVLSIEERGCHFMMKVGATLKQVDWIQLFQGEGAGHVTSMHLAVNKDGVCLMSGSYRDAMKFGNIQLYSYVQLVNSTQTSEMYLTAVSLDGKVLWAQSMGVRSWDYDVVALTGGGFIATGYFYRSSYLGDTKLPQDSMSGYFLMEIDPATGKHGKLFSNDTSAIQNLQAGSANDFYCDFQHGNSSYVRYVYHFDSNLKSGLISRLSGYDCMTSSRAGTIYYYGTWAGYGNFGFIPYEHTIGGDFSKGDAFFAKFRYADKK